MRQTLVHTIITSIPVMMGFLLNFGVMLLVLPIAALVLHWLWNDIAAALHHTHLAITYWHSLKLCFFIYLLKYLLSIEVTIKTNPQRTDSRYRPY